MHSGRTLPLNGVPSMRLLTLHSDERKGSTRGLPFGYRKRTMPYLREHNHSSPYDKKFTTTKLRTLSRSCLWEEFKYAGIFELEKCMFHDLAQSLFTLRSNSIRHSRPWTVLVASRNSQNSKLMLISCSWPVPQRESKGRVLDTRLRHLFDSKNCSKYPNSHRNQNIRRSKFDECRRNGSNRRRWLAAVYLPMKCLTPSIIDHHRYDRATIIVGSGLAHQGPQFTELSKFNWYCRIPGT